MFTPSSIISFQWKREIRVLLSLQSVCSNYVLYISSTNILQSQFNPLINMSLSTKHSNSKVEISFRYFNIAGTAVAQCLRCCTTNRKVAGSISAGVNGLFIDIKFFRLHYGPGVDSASNRNEYRVYLLGVKAAGA